MESLTSSFLAYGGSQGSYIKALKLAQSQYVSIEFSNFVGLSNFVGVHNGARRLYLS